MAKEIERTTAKKVRFPFFSDEDAILNEEGAPFFIDEDLITNYTDKFGLEKVVSGEAQTKSNNFPSRFDSGFVIEKEFEVNNDINVINIDKIHAEHNKKRPEKKEFIQIRSGVRARKNPVFNPINERTNNFSQKSNVKKNLNHNDKLTKKQVYSGSVNRFKPRPVLPSLVNNINDKQKTIDESKIKQAFNVELFFSFDSEQSEKIRNESLDFKKNKIVNNNWHVGAPRVSAEQKKPLITATNKSAVAPSTQTIYNGSNNKTIFHSNGYQPVYSKQQRIANVQDEVAKTLKLNQTINHDSKQKISDSAVRKFGQKNTEI